MSLSITSIRADRPTPHRRRWIAASSAIVAIAMGMVMLITIDRLRASRSAIDRDTSALRALARAMNGDLTVESEEGKGARFTVLLEAV